jgi:Recombinase
MLQNRTYLGEIVHKGQFHPGEHTPIIDQPLWDAVQEQLAGNTARHRCGGRTRQPNRVGVGHRRHQPQIDAAQAQHVLLFLGLRLGHHDDGAVAARIADERKADPGIAGGALDDDSARLQQPPLLGVLDDVERGPVLGGAAGVEELGLP